MLKQDETLRQKILAAIETEFRRPSPRKSMAYANLRSRSWYRLGPRRRLALAGPRSLGRGGTHNRIPRIWKANLHDKVIYMPAAPPTDTDPPATPPAPSVEAADEDGTRNIGKPSQRMKRSLAGSRGGTPCWLVSANTRIPAHLAPALSRQRRRGDARSPDWVWLFSGHVV